MDTKDTARLRDLWKRHLAIPFPRGCRDPRLSDPFVDLVAYDGHIAGIVSSYLAGTPSPYPASPADDLRRKLVELRSEVEGEVRAKVDQYLDYLEGVEEMARVVAGLME